MSKFLKARRALSGLIDLTGFLRNTGLVLIVSLPTLVIFFITATKAEESDSFCTACHTAPEQTYFDRSRLARDLTANQIVDLAGAHAAQDIAFKCIDCHRGQSTLADRVSTLALGARDALIFINGQADSTIEKGQSSQPDLLNRACWQCHNEAVTETGFNNHFHTELAVVSPTQPASSVTCIDCHQAHIPMESGVEQQFLNIDGVVYGVCERCHQELQKGPQALKP
jgi:hypothetical protein